MFDPFAPSGASKVFGDTRFSDAQQDQDDLDNAYQIEKIKNDGRVKAYEIAGKRKLQAQQQGQQSYQQQAPKQSNLGMDLVKTAAGAAVSTGVGAAVTAGIALI